MDITILYQAAEELTLGGFPNQRIDDSTWQLKGVAMGQPIAVRMDFTALEVRRLARRAKDSDQVRRLLAVAAVLDGFASGGRQGRRNGPADAS
jgi:hypothetical protein